MGQKQHQGEAGNASLLKPPNRSELPHGQFEKCIQSRHPLLRCVQRNEVQCGEAAQGLLVLRGDHGPVRRAGSHYGARAQLVAGTWPRHLAPIKSRTSVSALFSLGAVKVRRG